MKAFSRIVRTARVLPPVVLALLAGGCVTATIEEYREGGTTMNPDDRIVILGRRHASGYATETGFVDCIGNSLDNNPEGVQVIPEQEFVDTLFPWFEPRTAPLKSSDLPELLGNPLVSERIDEAGIRYLVWIDGSTDTVDQAGSMTCSISPGGGGCFGFVTWARDSSYEASVWDLQTARTVGRISSDATGTSYMPALIVPLPLIARVQAQACGGLAQQLEAFLMTEG